MTDARHFTTKQRRYLESLPAVTRVTDARISYADWFRDDCMRRYEAGASPTQMFREAGLDPRLIGNKRIERCFARWKRRRLSTSGEKREGGVPDPVTFPASPGAAAGTAASGVGVSVDTNAGDAANVAADAASAENPSAEATRSDAALASPTSPSPLTPHRPGRKPHSLAAPAIAYSEDDPRDHLIAYQALRIKMLEQEVRALHMREVASRQ